MGEKGRSTVVYGCVYRERRRKDTLDLVAFSDLPHTVVFGRDALPTADPS